MACRNLADSSNTYLAYGIQADCGIVATTMKFMRITSNSLQFTAESTESAEIRADGNVGDLIRTNVSVGGSIDFELSYTDFLPFWEAVMRQDSGTLPSAIWNGDASGARTYFTFEDKVSTSSGDYYRVFADAEISEMTISLEQGSIVTGSMTILGRSHTTSNTPIDPATAPAGTDSIFNTVNHVASIQLDGDETCDVSSIDITMTNNLREQFSLCANSDLGPAGVARGVFSTSGSITVYFPDDSLYNKFLQDQEFTLLIKLEDGEGNSLEFFIPRAKFGDLSRTVDGLDSDILMGGSYQALVSTNPAESAVRLTAVTATPAP